MNPAGTYDEVILLQRDEYDNIVMPDGSDGNYLEPEGSYYFYQPGVSHSYEVEWAGPYLALDMSYLINQYNQISGRIELGLPSYSVTANQPGRYELQHPKSVEDEGGIGDAFHFGLGANWSTAITDKVALSIGLTYDYYTVSDATAKTYVNSGYYTSAYDQMLADLKGAGYTEEQINSIPQVIDLKDYIDLMSAQGWTYTDEKEIESVFKSMGIRVGINARF